MTRYIVEVTGEVMVEADSLEFAVTLVRQMLGDDLDLAEKGMSLEVVAHEPIKVITGEHMRVETTGKDLHSAIDEAMKHSIRCCYWCGSRFRPTPGPDGLSQRYCSDACGIDSKNLGVD